MASINKVILIGNLGADPEVRFTGSGQAVATLRLATNERWQDKSGQKQERTEWHRVVAWGRLAELCKEYLTKGRSVYIEGRLQTREWADKEGNKRYTTEIVAQQLQFLGAPGERSTKTSFSEPSVDTESTPTEEPPTPGFPVNNNDDIPF